MTSQPLIPTSDSAADLIALSRSTKPDFVIQNILSQGEIFLLHGFEETFKSVLAIEIAAAVAEGKDLPGLGWEILKPRRVGVLETEMHREQMGARLARMYPDGHPPSNLVFMHPEVLKGFKRAKSIEKKFLVVSTWAKAERLEVIVIDTCNDFFRGKEDPRDETKAGEFFDRLRELEIATVIVRHDRKIQNGSGEAGLSFDVSGNDNIRGSAEFKEDPEVIFHIGRRDKRIHEISVTCGKMRYGRKPEPVTLWCDAGSFRMTRENPVVAILGNDWMLKSRIYAEALNRFGLSERKTDDMLKELKPILTERQAGHSKQFRVSKPPAKLDVEESYVQP